VKPLVAKLRSSKTAVNVRSRAPISASVMDYGGLSWKGRNSRQIGIHIEGSHGISSTGLLRSASLDLDLNYIDGYFTLEKGPLDRLRMFK
jgi:hypothetical protein